MRSISDSINTSLFSRTSEYYSISRQSSCGGLYRGMAPKRRSTQQVDDEEPSTSYATQNEPISSTQFSQNQSSKFTDDELASRANDLARFFIATASRKTTIKRQEINEKVLKEMSRSFNLVLERCRTILSDVFGLKLVEIDKPNKSFCVVNEIELTAEKSHLSWSHAEYQQSALLITVLSVIFMTGEFCSEEIVWTVLRRLGLEPDASYSEAFGDIKKLLTQDLVHQGYLIYKRQPDSDPPKHEFAWGPRALHIITKEDVLAFVCSIYGDMKLHDWTQQFDSIYGEGAAAKAKGEAVQSQED